MLTAMAVGAGIGALGSLANTGLSFGINQYSSKKAAKKAYLYWRRSQLEGPSLQRQGLEKAGYNPMLALSQGAASFNQGVSAPQVNAGDFVGSARQGGEFAKEAVKGAKAQIANIEADTALKQGQLDAVEAQRLQTEANTSLLQSQAERSDLAYGRDIVDTITGIAGTGASLYSAKAMADVAKANAAVNARNATVNERRLDSHTSEIRRNAKGKVVGSVERQHFSHGVPTVDSSAKGSNPNAVSALGSSAKSAGGIAKELAKDIVFSLPLGVVGAGVGAGMAHVREREVKEHLKKSEDKSRKWYHNFDRFHFDY